MQGKVVSSAGGIYSIYSNGIYYNVFPKGIFRYVHQNILVGDDVIIDDLNNTILDVMPRKNSLIRPKMANIDQIFIVMSLKEPDISFELLYKFATYVNMNNISFQVILTKSDLADEKLIDKVSNELNVMKIMHHFVNKFDVNSIVKIKETMNGKISVFLGQTGVGKSSLINLIDPTYNRKIGSYSISRGRGRHQTKEVILLPFEEGFIADTPGFSALDLGIYKEDLAQFFPGFNSLYVSCQYTNCLHLNENNCKIKGEVKNGNLSQTSYEIYLKLLNELEYKNKRYK